MSADSDEGKDSPYVSLSIPVRVPVDNAFYWPPHLKSRRRVLRAFDRWYKANQQDFAIKLKFLRRTDTCIDFAFVGITPVIAARIFPDEIAIYVTWLGESWDFLADIETYPIRIKQGFVCSACDPAVRPIVSTREMLWRIELFQELLLWVNHTLAPASRLSIVGSGGMLSAKLVE